MILIFSGERGSLTDLLSAGITNEMIDWLGPLIEYLQLPESKIIQLVTRELPIYQLFLKHRMTLVMANAWNTGLLVMKDIIGCMWSSVLMAKETQKPETEIRLSHLSYSNNAIMTTRILSRSYPPCVYLGKDLKIPWLSLLKN